MLISLLAACLPPVLSDTGAIPVDTSVLDDTDTGNDTGGDTADDTGDTGTQIEDADGDGYFPRDAEASKRDCDDNNPNAYPGAAELLSYVDEDCDGILVESIDAFTGAVKLEPVGLAWALEGLLSPGGKPVLAAGLVGSGVVMVVPASDMTDGTLGNSGGAATVSSTGPGNFGFSLVPTDFDADGASELFIGEPGSNAGDDSAYYVLPGDAFDNGAVNASSLSRVGDASLLTRVGVAGCPVGQIYALTAVHAAGTKVYLLDGEAVLNGEIVDVQQGAHIPSGGSTLGLGVALAGLDVDTDAGVDLVVGAPKATPAARALSGAVLVFSSGSLLSTPGETVNVEDADIVIGGSAANDGFGGFALGVADVTGDGAADMVVSDYRDDDERNWYLVPGNLPHGSYSIDDVALSRVIDTTPYVSGDGQVASRSAVATNLDDVDGFELVLGSPGDAVGSISVFSGSLLATAGTYAPTSSSAGVSSATAGDFFGFALAAADADGDADEDLVVTAPGTGEGAAWLIPNDF